MDAKAIKKFFQKLKNSRGEWETRWQEAAEYCCPIYADVTTTQSPGAERGINTRLKRNDPTAIKCVNLFAKTIHSLVFPPTHKNVDFIEDRLYQASAESKAWFSSESQKVQDEFNISNLDKELSSFFKILGWHGMPVLYFDTMYDERLERKVFHFTTLHPKEAFICDATNKRPSRFMRLYKMNLRDIFIEWPELEANSILSEKNKKNPEEELEILHYVYENRNERSRYPFISKHVLLELSIFCTQKDKGYYTFPYLILPWEPVPGERYANSLAFDAMPAVKSLNEAVGLMLDNWEKALNPPTLAETGSLLDPSLDLSSAAINWCNDISKIKTLIDQGRWDVAFEVVAALQKQIETMFYIDQMQLPPMEGTPHTAYEIQVRVEFQARILGPMFGTHNYNFLDLLIERAVDIMHREEMFTKPPDEILEGGFKPKYVGPLSKAQALTEAMAIEQYLTEYAAIVSNAPQVAETNPRVLVMHNWDRIFDRLADARSVPRDIFLNTDEVNDNVKKLQDMQAAQQQAALAGQSAKAYKDYQTGQKMAQGG